MEKVASKKYEKRGLTLMTKNFRAGIDQAVRGRLILEGEVQVTPNVVGPDLKCVDQPCSSEFRMIDTHSVTGN